MCIRDSRNAHMSIASVNPKGYGLYTIWRIICQFDSKWLSFYNDGFAAFEKFSDMATPVSRHKRFAIFVQYVDH